MTLLLRRVGFARGDLVKEVGFQRVGRPGGIWIDAAKGRASPVGLGLSIRR